FMVDVDTVQRYLECKYITHFEITENVIEQGIKNGTIILKGEMIGKKPIPEHLKFENYHKK
ncbi:MAG: hypothetical protein WCG67_10340, partial [Ferruginibacter sp.]